MHFSIWCVVCLYVFGFIVCTFDLNFKELQYIAGQLEPHECRKLSESLHDKKLFTTEKHKLTGNHEPNKTCLFLLLKYDRSEGRGKSFQDLAIRLRQIGRPDLAGRLSQLVYHEKAREIKKDFLDDPYREMIRKNSFMLDEEKPKKKISKGESESSFNWEAFWVCVAIMALVGLTCVGFQIFCPQFGKRLWHRFASQGAIDACNLCDDECSRCWRNFKLNYEKHVVGNDEVPEEFDDIELLLKESGISKEDFLQNEREIDTADLLLEGKATNKDLSFKSRTDSHNRLFQSFMKNGRINEYQL